MCLTLSGRVSVNEIVLVGSPDELAHLSARRADLVRRISDFEEFKAFILDGAGHDSPVYFSGSIRHRPFGTYANDLHVPEFLESTLHDYGYVPIRVLFG